VPVVSSQGIFLSYRREDATPYALLLHSRLRERFPDVHVFMDLEAIEPGLDFAEVIRQAVVSCAVLVALIGRQWATLIDEQGRRRLDDPDDWVRSEIQAALERGVRVIPVLVDGARPLQAEQMPAELRKLARLQALELSNDRYEYDTGRLLALIHRVLPDVRSGEDNPLVKDFREVVLGFDSADMAVRNETARKVKNIGARLELEDALSFCRSPKTAERVGGVIALGVHLRSSKETRGDRRVLSALHELLTADRSSFVRYRAAEVLRSSPTLVQTYDDELRHLADTDENSWVRRMAAQALQADRR
jgi:hypothetical protein